MEITAADSDPQSFAPAALSIVALHGRSQAASRQRLIMRRACCNSKTQPVTASPTTILLVLACLTSGSGCVGVAPPANCLPLAGFHRGAGHYLHACACGSPTCQTAHLNGPRCCVAGERASSVPGSSTAGGCDDESTTYQGGLAGCVPEWAAWRGAIAPTRPRCSWHTPQWWSRWRAKRELPEPPDYPRFHPLPTRPMFSPPPPPLAADGSS